jgi:hypothetical protein
MKEKSSQKSPLEVKIDWQHVVIFGLALAGGVVCALDPRIAQFVGPVLSGVIPFAIAKKSPLLGLGTAGAASQPCHPGGKQSDDETSVTIINVAVEPKELRLTAGGDLKVVWRDDVKRREDEDGRPRETQVGLPHLEDDGRE